MRVRRFGVLGKLTRSDAASCRLHAACVVRRARCAVMHGRASRISLLSKVRPEAEHAKVETAEPEPTAWSRAGPGIPSVVEFNELPKLT